MSKLSKLTAQEALDYTLKNSRRGIITVGTIKNGEASYKVYGENGVELSAEAHTYEIGSLTKTITASMVCKAVQAGIIALDAPIDTYLDLPKKAHYPTIEQLVTHTSGYKNYYFEAPMTANTFKGRNSFYGIGNSIMLNRLAKTDIADSKYGFKYSNFGYATLGLILEKVYNAKYAKLTDDYVKNELGLINTHISTGDGDLGGYWDWAAGDTYMAAGALTSDIEDMLKYAKLMLNGAICGGECLKPLKELNVHTAQNEMFDIHMDEIAYAWIIDSSSDVAWHNGGTSNYNSYMGLDLKNQVAVVMLANLAPTYKIPVTIPGIKAMKENTR